MLQWSEGSLDKHTLIPLLVASLVPAMAAAQDAAPISAERPGFSSSPTTLSPSMLQVETGYQYTRDGGGDFSDHTLPLALIRVGLAERLELQLSWAGISWTEVGGRDFDGANDAGIGVKWQVTGSDALFPLAFFAGLSLPVGDDEFSSDDVDPTLGVFWTHSAGLDWFGTVLLSESDGDVTVGNALGVSLPIDADTGAYIEYFGSYGGGAGPEHVLNGGVAYLPRRDLQLDVHAGAGLNGRAVDFFLGLGLAYRF